MSLHYIIDGYNIMRQVKRLTGRRLNSSRENFIRFLETERPYGSPRNKVTVVFDGHSDVYAPVLNSEIEIIFSRSESADDRIKKIVGNLQQKNLVVVSDDNMVQWTAKAQGARVLGAREFLVRKTHRADRKTREEEKIHPDTKLGMEITKELKKIWLLNKKTQMGTD